MNSPYLDEINPWEADDRFVPIFGRVLSAPGVSLVDAYLYGLLASYRGRESNGACFPSHERIARDLRTDKRYVRRRLKRLEELGLIRIDRSGNRIGKPNRYWFLHPTPPGQIDPRVDNTPGSQIPAGSNDPEPGGHCDPEPGGTSDPPSILISKIRVERNKSKSPSDVRRVFDRWVDTHWNNKGPKPKLDKKRTAKIKQRFAEAFTVEQLWQAIDGCRASSWHMGDNSSGTRYNKLETILRDAGTVEAHINRLLSSREVQPTDPIDSEFASLVAEKNSGPTPERLLAVDTRLAELAAMRQRERASGSTFAPVAVGGRQ